MARYSEGYTYLLLEPMYADEARGILRKYGISQEAAARKMGLDPRTLGRHVSPTRAKALPGPVALVLRYWKEHPALIPKG